MTVCDLLSLRGSLRSLLIQDEKDFSGDLIAEVRGQRRASKDEVAYWVNVLEGEVGTKWRGAGANT